MVHQFFYEFVSASAVEEKTSFCSQFASCQRNDDKYLLKNFVDLEFEIGETN